MLALWLTTGFLANSGDAPAVEAPVTTAGRASWSYIRKRVAKADDADKLAEVVILAAPSFEGDPLQSEYAAIRLKAERLAKENADLAQWQSDMGRAALIMEFRALMLSIEAAANDDEEAAFALLLAA